jgi:hypothetical protein
MPAAGCGFRRGLFFCQASAPRSARTAASIATALLDVPSIGAPTDNPT